MKPNCIPMPGVPVPERAQERLDRIIQLAFKCSDYYRQSFAAAGLKPGRQETLADLPIVPSRALAARPLDFKTATRSYRVAAGSGTTGRPKLMFRTRSDLRRSAENEAALLSWAGVRSDDVVAVAQAFDLWACGELTQRAVLSLGASVVPVGLIPDEDALGVMCDTRTTVLDTTPSRLERMLHLSERWSRDQLPPIRVVMVSGEPLRPELIRRAADLWGAGVFDQYGSEETDGLAGAREPGCSMKLLDEDFLFELAEPSEGPLGTIGRLVVTSLYHAGTPLIRYLLDDIVQAERSRPGHLRVLGRGSDCFFLHNGLKLHLYQVDAALDSAGISVKAWQCTLLPGVRGEVIEFEFVPSHSDDANSSDADAIKAALDRTTFEVAGSVAEGDLEFRVSATSAMPEWCRRGKTRRFTDRRPTTAGMMETMNG